MRAVDAADAKSHATTSTTVTSVAVATVFASTDSASHAAPSRANFRRALVAMCDDPAHVHVVEDHFWNWIDLAVSWLRPLPANNVDAEFKAEAGAAVGDMDVDTDGVAIGAAVGGGSSGSREADSHADCSDTRSDVDRDAAECAVAVIRRVVDVAGPRECVPSTSLALSLSSP